MPPTIANGSLILEEPLIRTPYELLRRSHRSAQRQVEKDFTSIQAGLAGILKSLPDSNEIATKLDSVGDKARGLKRKLDDLQPSIENPTALRHRLTYLDGLSKVAKPIPEVITTKVEKKDESADGEAKGDEASKSAASEDISKEVEMEVDLPAEDSKSIPEPNEDNDKTLDRYIVDFLLRTKRVRAAKALADAQGIENLVDIKLFSELIKIQKALVAHQSVTEALAWCGENRGTLKKTKNNLEFTLRLQDFIELCRKRDTSGAIAYSRKYLSTWTTSHMKEIQSAMTLLAFGERTGVASYRKFYDKSRWNTVWLQFKETFLTLYALPSQPLLSLALSAGLSSLRLPSCVQFEDPTPLTPKSPNIPLLPAAPPLHSLESILASPPPEAPPDPAAPTGNVDCPTCHPELKILAREVPMSHHVNSTIVCRISGQVMDSQNEPLAFPNGYVYSSKALTEMANNNFGIVTCPRTRETCAFSRLRKVYIS